MQLGFVSAILADLSTLPSRCDPASGPAAAVAPTGPRRAPDPGPVLRREGPAGRVRLECRLSRHAAGWPAIVRGFAGFEPD